MTMHPDYPLAEIWAECEREIASGAFILQKWTCDGCGERVMSNNLNTFTALGRHEDCGAVTDMAKRGCNYMKIQTGRAATAAEVAEALGLNLPPAEHGQSGNT